jgi:hypothetical protein
MHMFPITKLGRPTKRSTFKFEHDLLAMFDFGGGGSGQCSPAQQERFQKDFEEQLAKVRAELSKHKWLPTQAPMPPRVSSGQYLPRTDFLVSVSNAYSKAIALVPAWLGQRGRMEFPAHRVVAGQATIAHELVHVLFPNANRMLAEGLAVYLQYKLFPEIQAWPNFGNHLETVVEDFLNANYPNSAANPSNASNALWNMDLEALEQISSPDELSLRIGRDAPFGASPGVPDPTPEEEKGVYGVAGSIVGFLLENLIDDDLLTEKNFGDVYKSTPLRPLERDAGDPARWKKYYKGKDDQGKDISYSFSDLGLLWKTYVHFILFGNDDKIHIPKRFLKNGLVAGLYDRLTTHAPPAK